MDGYEGFESLLGEREEVVPPDPHDSMQAFRELEPAVGDEDPTEPLPAAVDRAARSIAETFARRWTRTSTVLLHAPCRTRLEGVGPSGAEELMAGLLPLSCLGLVRVPATPDPGLLRIDGPLVSSILTRLLGGPPEPAPVVRELTGLELALAARLLELALGELEAAAEGIVDLRPRLARVECHPECLSSMARGPYVTVRLHMAMDSVEGSWELHLPGAVFESIDDGVSRAMAILASTAADPAAPFEGGAVHP